jgi:phosphatidylserine decarboxylase
VLKDDLFIASQYLLPQHLLSRVVGKLAACENITVKNFLIRQFMDQFGIRLDDAARQSREEFKSFNDFFTRELRPGARPLDTATTSLVSPADGAISQLGKIQDGRIFQAKGQDFSLLELLGGNQQRAAEFTNGQFATVYLSPRDYHRVHMPISGTLREMVYVPGALFSVNQTTAANVPRLFARNERLVAIFDTEIGPMAMVLVGAMIVAAIETVWSGRITPAERTLRVFDYRNPGPVTLNKGDEMGRFLLGSTVILCFGENALQWDRELESGSPVRMGKRMATLGNTNSAFDEPGIDQTGNDTHSTELSKKDTDDQDNHNADSSQE